MDCLNLLVQDIYRIKLPGPAILGEGKPENQNHAIIFTRGEGLQTIDMNQVHTHKRPYANALCMRVKKYILIVITKRKAPTTKSLRGEELGFLGKKSRNGGQVWIIERKGQ